MNYDDAFAKYVRHVVNPTHGDPSYALQPSMCEYIANEITSDVSVLELGAGFSSVMFRSLSHVTSITTVDHDIHWAKVVSAYLWMLPALWGDLSPRIQTTDWWRAQSMDKKYDVVLLDHGPTMNTRINDLTRAVNSLAPGGMLFADDWHGAYRKTQNRQLPGSAKVYVAEFPRKDTRDRHIAKITF